MKKKLLRFEINKEFADPPHHMTAPDIRKKSYTIPCSGKFRDSALDLARRRGTNVADRARSVVLMLAPGVIAAHPDPGEPAQGDREIVVLKSGPAKGRPWRRKPRLQVRMAPGLAVPQIRRALALALAIDRGDVKLRLARPGDGNAPAARPELPDSMLLRETREELDRLRTIVSVLSFEPISGGVATLEDALHILGFPPARRPNHKLVRDRFRMLATIHHPDSSMGSHLRMSQLNAAMEILRIYSV